MNIIRIHYLFETQDELTSKIIKIQDQIKTYEHMKIPQLSDKLKKDIIELHFLQKELDRLVNKELE